MRRLALALLGAAACARLEITPPPQPLVPVGDAPAVGRRLDLDVEGRGTPVRLQGVVGRVTVVCVLGPGAEAGSDPVLDACLGLAEAFRDRVAVVGLTTEADVDLDRFPLRTYRDPEGRALHASLELDPAPRLIFVDTRRRVAELLSPLHLDRVHSVASRLVR